MGANREFKSSLFSELFSDPVRLRELYNAIANTNYGEDTPVELNTLEDILIKDLKNDVSFVIDDKFVVLIEHQSTLSENMPLRILLYIARLYERIAKYEDVYRDRLLKIPTPEFIVLYNGEKKFPDERIYRLSDAYKTSDESVEKFGSMELTVRVVNINPNGNAELLGKSSTLAGYSEFIEQIRRNKNSGMELLEAIKQAIEYCIDNGVLSAFLTERRSEVENMLYTEFDIDVAKAVWQEEAREEGREEERLKQIEERRKIVNALRSQGFDDEKIAGLTGISLETI